jgi:mono/diheme cytochrome c family protein
VRSLSSALVLLFAVLLPQRTTSAQSATRTTAQGVYTAAQAKSGGDVYTMLCQSCHAAVTHTGAPFKAKWTGRPLSDLFTYIREEMPKTEPGSLSEEEYTLVLAYILRMNGMPAGRKALSPNEAELRTIRIELPPDAGSAAQSGSPGLSSRFHR